MTDMFSDTQSYNDASAMAEHDRDLAYEELFIGDDEAEELFI